MAGKHKFHFSFISFMLPRVTRKIKQALIRRKAKKNGILTRNLLIMRYLLSHCATTTTQPTLTERNFRNLLTEAHDKKSNNFFPKCVNIKLRFAFSISPFYENSPKELSDWMILS